MDLQTRKTLREALTKISTEIASALRLQLLAPGPARDRAVVLHRDEKVGDAFELWTDLLSRRAAVLWVLKSLYIRALEDRGLLRPARILDAESEQLFAHLAPNLGPTAYLRWIFRDLSTGAGGLPELFAPQPAEIAVVPDALSRKLIDLWRGKDPDTGVVRYRFDDEHFDGRLLGDLYQDLDPVVKKRYALLQTPDFVLDFILDETLTPAIAEFGLETVRVLDPACGSGHFLLAAFKRLVAGMREKEPQRPLREVVRHVLDRVVGIDLNDYACGLARARLVMTALEVCGEGDLAAAHDFHPQVYCADALEQVELDEQLTATAITPVVRESIGMLTPPEVRTALRAVLKPRFHVVVGNPPYVTEKDPAKKEYHRTRLGKSRRYVSASGAYSLGAPFTERMLQLAVDGGFVGEITADSFMKREFGKVLIQEVLSRRDLVKVVSAAGAFIPGHGTPTVILFVRNQTPRGMSVRAVMGKRSEPGKPADPAQGRVWRSILEGHANTGFENEFVSVADLPRSAMNRHPWSIGGGGASALKELLDQRAAGMLGSFTDAIGRTNVAGENELWIATKRVWERLGVGDCALPFVIGESVRDWAIAETPSVIYPYVGLGGPTLPASHRITRVLWGWRALLENRTVFGKQIKAVGRPWWEHLEHYAERLRSPLSIAIGFVVSHNQFALDSGGKAFSHSAPVIKLRSEFDLSTYLVLVAQLNSATACFWLKQVCQNKGAGGVDARSKQPELRLRPDEWAEFIEVAATKLESFPLARSEDVELERFARLLDTFGRARVDDSARATVDQHASAGVDTLGRALKDRRVRDFDRLTRMVSLQEELDWLCYRLYGIDADAEVRDPDAIAPAPPGLRAFEISLARDDAERREAIGRGEEPEELPTSWFERHGWQAHTTVNALPPSDQLVVQARLDRTEASRELSLLEQPKYKRRWYKPDYDSDERDGLTLWLQDRIEDWAMNRREPFTVAQAAAALRSDSAVLAVGELLTGRADFDVDALVGEQIVDQAVPSLKAHVFKPEGLRKRAQWEETWRLQHLEDAGEKVVPPVPPKYDTKDFLRNEYWSLRGKLDVPKERFIAFTEAPAAVSDAPLYGWAGWTHRERARVLLALDEKADDARIDVKERYGLLYGAWFLLPYVAWEDAKAAADMRADVKGVVGEQGVTEAMLEEWAAAHPPPGRGRAAAKAPATLKVAKKRAAKAIAGDANGES
jgi:hypothetical protein